ncbi:uncharacterized protein [Ptychodera flava]|uniref:uncharacterized protein n=1 Tax=Ptychodera flava TaxID=63121 RepID=UPI00396A541F
MKFVLFMLVVAVVTRESYGRDNVALNKPVTGIRLEQGTLNTLPYLVDGTPNTCADSGPAVVTRPAFQIDLGGDHLVQGVKLVFPNDCKETLSGYGCGYHETFISVSDEQNGKGEVCARINDDVFEPNGEFTLKCKAGPVIGRYITLVKEIVSSLPRAIYLCELKVYGQGRDNVALNKPVTGIRLEQGTLNTLPYLVDGTPNTCADSGPGVVTRPAFQIDLGGDHLVQGVKLVFPNDCTETLSGYGCGYHETVISVSDEQNGKGEVCARIKDDVFEPNGEFTLKCKAGPVIGRYITLVKEIVSSLPRAIYLCELKVYGQGRDNVALNKPVTGIRLEQGTLNTLPYLVDGTPNTCADSGPGVVTRPAFQIDLGGDHLVQGVKLVFPNDCTETLSGYGCGYHETVISVSDEQNGKGEVCARIKDDVFEPNGEFTLKCKAGPVIGRYITLVKEIVSSLPRAIYLCELKVYGQGRDNVALNKPVTGIRLEQGTLNTLPYLVDGTPNTCADSGPGVVTRPAFQIDLGGDHLVQGVKLVFPNDCTETLSGYGCGYHETVISVSDEQNGKGEVW